MGALERITDWFTALDGVAVLLLGAAFLVSAAWRLSREDPPWVRPALAVITALGLAVRLGFSVDAPMNAWAFHRRLPLALMVYEGPVLGWLAAHVRGFTPYFTDVISGTNLVLAALTPLVFFSHARYLLRDARAAVAAALFIALLPMHVRFSRSDVQFIFSLVTSSLTFVVLYGALCDPSARWRRLCFVLLPLLCGATYFARPENIVFAALDGGALLLYLRADVPRRRQALAFALMGVAALFALMAFTLHRHGADMRQGLDRRTLAHALTVLGSQELNTLLNPHMTPQVLPALAAGGLGAMVLRGDRGRAVFLFVWLAGFFVLHSYVRTDVPEMEARYHLQLVTPFVFMAAAAVPALLDLRRWLALAPALWMLAAPWLHREFIGDVRFNEMAEFAFLRSVRGRIPDGCRVLEFMATSTMQRGATGLSSHVSRLTSHRAAQGLAFTPVVRADADLDAPGESSAEPLSDEARALLDGSAPAGCLYVFTGLSCYVQRPLTTDLAPVCETLQHGFDLEPVAARTVTARYYDDAYSGRILVDEARRTRVVRPLQNGDLLTFTLARVRGLRRP